MKYGKNGFEDLPPELRKQMRQEGGTLPPSVDIDTVIQSVTDNGEQTLWSGQPDPVYFRERSGILKIFGFFWIGFILVWSLGVMGFDIENIIEGDFEFIQIIMLLFSVPFWIIGIKIFSIPRKMAKQALNTVYAVTDKRCLVISSGKTVSVNSINYNEISDLDWVARPDGSGDIKFQLKNQPARQTSANTSFNRALSPGIKNEFIGIPDVKQVESVIRSKLP